jgi:hypothetical protein
MDWKFKYTWRAFWWGFFHPFSGKEVGYKHATALAKEQMQEQIRREAKEQ